MLPVFSQHLSREILVRLIANREEMKTYIYIKWVNDGMKFDTSMSPQIIWKNRPAEFIGGAWPRPCREGSRTRRCMWGPGMSNPNSRSYFWEPGHRWQFAYKPTGVSQCAWRPKKSQVCCRTIIIPSIHTCHSCVIVVGLGCHGASRENTGGCNPGCYRLGGFLWFFCGVPQK